MTALPFIEVDGFRLPPTFDPDTFRDACKFKPNKDQVVVVTYPKCGKTWILQVVTLILRKGVTPADANEYFSFTPFMEDVPLSVLQNLRKDGCIKTHLPFDRIKFSYDAKYIYVARHPSNCVVSYYHHVKYFPIFFFSDGTFDEFFELFITGNTAFGDYFDHLLSWYEHKDDPNVLFVTFEEMRRDPRTMVLKIAKFLGNKHYGNLKQNENEILNKVLEYSSIEYMKNTVDKYYTDTFTCLPPENVPKQIFVDKKYAKIFKEATEAGHHSVGNFIRSGKVGEGKITLSEDQKKRLECRMKEKCSHSNVMNLWKNQY